MTDEPTKVVAAATRVWWGDPLVTLSKSDQPLALAPADGTVVGTVQVPLAGGGTSRALALDIDPAQGPDPLRQPLDMAAALSALHGVGLLECVERLCKAGVWADRWTSPDLLGQLRQALERRIDVVLCNVPDPDPAVPVQQSIAADHASDLLAAVATFARIVGAKRAWVVVPQDATEECWAALRAAARDADVRLVPVENHYPRANPTLLLHALAGRQLLPGRLPTEAGVLLLDAAAALAAADALFRMQPMLTVPVGVYDRTADQSHLVRAAVGTPVGSVLGEIGINPGCTEWCAGHPLRDLPVTANAVLAGTELILYASPPAAPLNPSPCIRCAWCVEACPVRIQPAGLLEAAQRQNPRMAAKYGLEACIACGICSYVCPSNLPLLQGIRTLRELPSATPERQSDGTQQGN